MMKKILLFLIITVLLCSFASAFNLDKLLNYYTTDKSSGLLEDVIGRKNGTAINLESQNATPCANNNCWSWEESIGSYATLKKIDNIKGNASRTYSAWLCPESLITHTWYGVGDALNPFDSWQLSLEGTNSIVFKSNFGDFTATSPLVSLSCQMISYVYYMPTRNLTIFHNETNVGSFSVNLDTDDTRFNTSVGSTQTLLQNFDGIIDEFTIWNRSLSPDEISEKFFLERDGNFSYLFGEPDTDSTPPLITILNPQPDEEVFSNVDINVSINESGFCSINNTLWSLQSFNDTFFSFTETTAPNNIIYSINISCNDTFLNPAYESVSFTKSKPEVIITSPENNSDVNISIVNITSLYRNFNATACYLKEINEFNEVVDSVLSISQNFTINETITVINTDDILNMYRFEEGSGVFTEDVANGNNATLNGNNYTSSNGGNGTGNYSLFFDGDDYVQAPNQDYYDFGTDGDFTISAWIRSEHGSDGQYHMILDFRDVSNDGVFLAVASDDTFQIAINTITSMQSIYTVTDSEWHHVVATIDRDNAVNTDIWVDNVSQGVGVVTNGQSISVASDLYIGRRSFSVGTFWEGDLDEIYIFNKSLNSSEISQLFTDGRIESQFTQENITINGNLSQNTNFSLIHSGIPDGVDLELEYIVNCTDDNIVILSDTLHIHHHDIIPPNITFLSPQQNVTLNTIIDINVTISENGTCSINNSQWSLTSSNDTFFSFTETNSSNGFYDILITCEDNFENLNTANIIFTKDVLAPNIIMFNPLQDNSSIFIGGLPLILSFNATDNIDLYSLDINITEEFSLPFGIPQQRLLYQEFVNLSGEGLNYHFYDSIPTLNWSNNSKDLNIRVCDSHTKNNIKDAKDIQSKYNSLIYEFDDGTIIEIISYGGSELNTSTIKDYDRYTLSFGYSSTYENKKYKILSNREIEYLSHTRYKGHFVINGIYWLDFEQEGAVNVDYECETEDNITSCFHVVHVKNDKQHITFNSLGELNCNVFDIDFSIISEDDSTSNFKTFQIDFNDLTHVFLLFVLVALYLGLMTLAMMYKNFAFLSFGFFIGIVIGLAFAQFNIFLTFVWLLINIIILLKLGQKFK